MSLPGELNVCPKLNAKHNIFLSHSGAQKPFVEQLCKDLEEDCHYPFFDQRDDSLPKGEEFASLIFDAARQCRVGVVVLSKEFLTSKWPMHELAAFVNAKESDNKSLNLLPLFFELSAADLSDECISSRWLGEWTKLAEEDRRVDVEKWKQAVQKLRAVNGLEFAKSGNSGVSYRKDVVTAIFKLVPPHLLYDISEVEGCARMCKILSEMFVEDTSSDNSRLPQPQKLGLYGMGGLGKTTMCKALCNHFQAEFCGRVCHVELGSEIPLVLQKKVLGKLLRLGENVLQHITDISQGQKCLKEYMRRQPVFLVIDNVGDDWASDCEARAYLDAGFHPNSKIMITSRSSTILAELLGSSNYCVPIPDLLMDEAAVIFLRKAAPEKSCPSLEQEEMRIVHLCLQQCRFSRDGDPDSEKDRQYHPLALIALGAYFKELHDPNLLLWEHRLYDFRQIRHYRERPPIFFILGLQFRNLDTIKKLMFLDIALYSFGFARNELKSLNGWVAWLAALHSESDDDVRQKLSDLERKALINQGESAVTIHDLYLSYAFWYLTEGGDEKDWCVYRSYAEDLPRELKRSPPGGCWPDLVRISMEVSVEVPSKKFQEWCNITVLQLRHCTKITNIDLQGFNCLCHLELVGLRKLEILNFADVNGDQYPLDLQFVILEGLNCLKHIPNFSFCTKLRFFVMEKCRSLTEPPNLESCSSLEILRADWYPAQLRAPNLTGLTSLRELVICGQQFGNEHFQLEGLSSMINLQSLHLSQFPITGLLGLEKLTKLRILNVKRCYLLTEFPDVRALTNLEMLNVSYTKVKEIPGSDNLLQLRTLKCIFCPELLWLPDPDQMPNLTDLDAVNCPRLKMVSNSREKERTIHPNMTGEIRFTHVDARAYE